MSKRLNSDHIRINGKRVASNAFLCGLCGLQFERDDSRWVGHKDDHDREDKRDKQMSVRS